VSSKRGLCRGVKTVLGFCYRGIGKKGMREERVYQLKRRGDGMNEPSRRVVGVTRTEEGLGGAQLVKQVGARIRVHGMCNQAYASVTVT
jgi:hypothetical protein